MFKMLFLFAAMLSVPLQANATVCPDAQQTDLRVKRIISDLAALTASDLDKWAKVAEQQRLFGELESLGQKGVPSIIAQMDDQRPLAEPQISLENHSPKAFEAVRHYGPEQIVDALDAVLGQITGASNGLIVNGGNAIQRSIVVAGWRSYAATLECDGSPRH